VGGRSLPVTSLKCLVTKAWFLISQKLNVTLVRLVFFFITIAKDGIIMHWTLVIYLSWFRNYRNSEFLGYFVFAYNFYVGLIFCKIFFVFAYFHVISKATNVGILWVWRCKQHRFCCHLFITVIPTMWMQWKCCENFFDYIIQMQALWPFSQVKYNRMFRRLSKKPASGPQEHICSVLISFLGWYLIVVQ